MVRITFVPSFFYFWFAFFAFLLFSAFVPADFGETNSWSPKRPDASQVLVGALVVGSLLVGLLLVDAMINRATYRLAVLGEKPAGSVISFSGKVWRLATGRVVILVISALVSLAVAFAFGFLGLTELVERLREQVITPDVPATPNAYLKLFLLVNALDLLAVIASLVVYLHLIAYLPVAACEDKLSLQRSLSLMRGHFWGTASVMLFTYLASIALFAILTTLLFGAGFGLWWGQGLLGDTTNLTPFGLLLLAGALIGYAIAMIYLLLLQLALPAVVYRHLVALEPAS